MNVNRKQYGHSRTDTSVVFKQASTAVAPEVMFSPTFKKLFGKSVGKMSTQELIDQAKIAKELPTHEVAQETQIADNIANDLRRKTATIKTPQESSIQELLDTVQRKNKVEPTIDAPTTVKPIVSEPAPIEQPVGDLSFSRKPLSPQAQAVRDVSEIPVGVSEDATTQAVRNLFTKQLDSQFKRMSNADRRVLEDNHTQAMQYGEVKDGIPMDDFGNKLFVKGADHALVGTLTGVDKDENGNMTFDPEKFIMGMGGYAVAKKLLMHQRLQVEIKDYIGRALNELDKKSYGQYLTGEKYAVEPSQTGVLKAEQLLHDGQQAEPLPISEAGNQSTLPNERVSNFNNFFKDSKVINKDGSPMTVYHGTKSSFDAFDPTKSRGGNFGNGLYFAEDVNKVNRHFANGYSSNIMPVNLAIKKPFDMDKIDEEIIKEFTGLPDSKIKKAAEYERPYAFYRLAIGGRSEEFRRFLESKGYDGITGTTTASGKQWVAFEPTQVKSIHNSGKYNQNNPNSLGIAKAPVIGNIISVGAGALSGGSIDSNRHKRCI